MIKEITTYIKNLLGSSYVIGTNVFAGWAPSSAEDTHVVVLDSGGTGNFYLPDRMEKMVQVLCRSTDYHQAMSLAMSVFTAINGKAGISLPVITTGEEYYVNTITAVSAPQSLGPDERGLFNISTNYMFKIQAA